MIDILLTTHNRKAYVEAVLATLLANTNWDLVHHLHIIDDHSIDGTYEFLLDAVRDAPVETTVTTARFGGPVAAMNHMLDRTQMQVFGKIDSDTIVPPGWLDTMLDVMVENPGLDGLGMEPGFAEPVQPDYVTRGYQPAAHVGGQGLFRVSAFAKHRPAPKDRYFGFTQFQRKLMTTGWIDPDIATFNLDHVPEEPWASLAASYVEAGWSRSWSTYAPSMAVYYEWWTKQQAAVT